MLLQWGGQAGRSELRELSDEGDDGKAGLPSPSQSWRASRVPPYRGHPLCSRLPGGGSSYSTTPDIRDVEMCTQVGASRIHAINPLGNQPIQNPNGIDFTVALLSLGMKWMYLFVVFGSRCPTNAAI